MLQFIRGKAGSWIIKILFLFLIISFGAWGVDGIFRGGNGVVTVAKVGGNKISSMELDNEFRQQVARLRSLSGGQMDLEQARAMGLLEQSLRQIIQRQLYDMAATEIGIRFDDGQVRRRIQGEPVFARNGQFDPEQFRRVLQANNLSEGAFVAMLRRDMVRELLVGAISVGAAAPEPLLQELHRQRNETRSAEVVLVRDADSPDPGIPDAATLSAFHQEKAIRFTAPEYRSVTLLTVGIEDLLADVHVTPEDLKAAFESRRAELTTPERRVVQQVLVAEEATARKIADAAGSASGLAAAAAAAGAEMQDLGQVMAEDLPDELAKPVFAIGAGSVAPPTRSPLGWHVMAVRQIEPAAAPVFEAVQEALLADLKRERAADRSDEVANKLDDLLAGGASLEDAAQRLGLRTRSLGTLDARGNSPEGQPVASDLVIRDAVLKQAFTQEVGRESRLTETREGIAFVVRVDQAMPPALRPLESIQAEVIAAWQAEQRTKAAETRAETVAASLGGGAPLASVAAEDAIRIVPAFLRTTSHRELPADLVRELFERKVGEVARVRVAEGQRVARLSAIIPADPTTMAAGLEPLRQEITQNIASELVEEFGAALRQRFPVAIYQDTLSAMYKPN